MRKTIVLFLIAIAMIPFCQVSGQTTSKATKKVDVYYFHGNHRCPTCKAIEKETHALLETSYKQQLTDGTIQLHIINFDDDKNEAIVKKYQVWGSSLLLVNTKGQITNLTDMAFASARTDAIKFKAELKKEIEKSAK